ncbi:MAG: acylphosphatase [Gemmatimonadota bacterium]|nr:acylphosphatase [Gemmatimonadota bacterium]MDH3368496.1 acylphosphatase [Gemmatimonadota bacterium]MDH3477128.1 acylphosphatase [Gemmatimonadota bacterium]MDH3569716.1 acylphosphatase [Gemmatimonadota bacterium]MDH5550400.1 acylphosphatase [Gemmatimonadota bacterium]
MNQAPIAVRLLLSGRVQGVGFRWFVMKRARDLPVAGWVRNLADGRVEVAVKGSRSDVEVLTAAVTAGPRLARVDNVEKYDVPVDVVADNSFEVR